MSRIDEIRAMSRPRPRTIEELERELDTRARCPVCDEDISAQARKCKHCGEVLDPSLAATLTGQVAPRGQLQAVRAGAAGGVPAPYTRTKSKVAAGLLALLLGGVGAHKFYLGRVGQGLLYLLFCWTFIPSLLGLIEGIIYLTMDDERFWQKYG